MICPKCQFDNLELNRFCGMCGSPLRDSESQAEPNHSEGELNAPSQGRRPFIVSTTATGDATLSNTRVVPPTPTIGSTTRSSYLPLTPLKAQPNREEIERPGPTAVDPLDEPLFAQATPPYAESHNMEAPVRSDRSARRPIPINDAPTSGSILGLSSAPIETDTFEETRTETDEEISDTTASETHSSRNSFLTFDDTPSSHNTDVSGPSFLGLGAADNPDYLLEERSSHARAYLFLFVLIIVGVLGFLEWRASTRGESINPMDVLHIKLPAKKAQGQAAVEPSANGSSATPSGSASGSTNDGKPDLVAEPTQSATQPASVPPANSAAAPEGAQTSTPSAKPADSTPPSNTTAAANTAPAPAASAKAPENDAAAEDESAAPPSPAQKKPADKKPVTVASAKSTPSKPSAAGAHPGDAADPSLNAGSFELQKGIAAGPTNEGRTWLWRAMGKGNGEAPVLLADIYAQGKGTPKDCEQAVLLLKAAAKKANPRARSKLGTMYASGQCVQKDRVEAYKWMHSALQVNPGSEWIEKNQESLWTQMTASERRRAAAYR